MNPFDQIIAAAEHARQARLAGSPESTIAWTRTIDKWCAIIRHEQEAILLAAQVREGVRP